MKRKITISESQIINAIKKAVSEARRNPETNVDESFSEFYNRMLNKAPIEDIFVSFRDSTHVTDVNPRNIYKTPTGFYTYPLSRYYSKDDGQITEEDFRRKFESDFGGDRKYINFFILKTHDGVLTHRTDKSTLDVYAERVKKLHPNVSEVKELCDSFIGGSYSSDYKTPVHNTHLFWLFLYGVAEVVKIKNKQTRISLMCRKIGVNGFIDYGDAYIHEYEPTQAVFFKVKSLGEIFIYETPKLNTNTINNAIQNKEYKTIRDLTGGIVLISLFGKYGLINNKGELISKQMFDYVDVFGDGFARVKLNDKWNFINQNSETLSSQWFDGVEHFKDGIAKVNIFGKGMNFINQNGELLLKQWFDYIGGFQGDIASVELNGKGYNFINRTGELISKRWFDMVSNFKEGVVRVWVDGKGVNIINQNGEIVSKQWFDAIDEFENGLARVKLENKGFNIINREGGLLFNQWFDLVDNFEDSFARVKLNSKGWNFMNQEGDIISKNWFDDATYYGDGFARVKMNNKLYDLNLNKKETKVAN